MSAVSALRAHSAAAAVTVTVGCMIAALAPFDLGLAYLTGGSLPARVVLFATITLAGLFFAERNGLSLRATGLRFPVVAPVAVAFLVAAYVVVLDCFVFRSLLPQSYVRVFQNEPLGLRLVSFMLRAWNENIMYRLFGMSALSYLIGLVWKVDDRPAAGRFVVAAIISQTINVYINVTAQLPAPVTPTMLIYDLVRYVFPGVLWGYLFWRYGFATAEIASVGTHPFLQPLLGELIGGH